MQEARAGRGAARAAGPAAAPGRLPAAFTAFAHPLRAWRRANEQAGEPPKGRRPLFPPARATPKGRGRSRTSSSDAPTPSSSSGAQTGDEIGGYTPADYITYSADPRHALRHAVEVQCNAPLSVCLELWSEWSGLVEFLDLIGKVGLDPDLPDMALLYCYYRWAKLPVMELSCLLKRDLSAPPSGRLGPAARRIAFCSEHGMPLKGDVEFAESPDGRTRVALRAEHPLPSLLALLGVAPSAVEAHVASVLGQNLSAFAALARARAPEGSWDREAAARRGKAAAAAQAAQAAAAAAQQQQQEASSSGGGAAAASAAARAATGGGGAAAAAAAAAGSAPEGSKEPRRRSRSATREGGGAGASAAGFGDAAASNGSKPAPRRRSGSRAPTESGGAAGGAAPSPAPGRRRTSTTNSSSAMARR